MRQPSPAENIDHDRERFCRRTQSRNVPLGHKRTSPQAHTMSALPPKADISERPSDVRFTPTSRHSDDRRISLSLRPLGVSDTHPVHVEDPANRNSTWTFRGEHFYIWLPGWPVYRQRLTMLRRKPIRPGRFVSSLAPFRAVLPTSLPA